MAATRSESHKTPASRFERALNRWDVFVLAFGAMIGWSWVVLADVWVGSGGSLGATLAFLIGGTVIVLIGLLYAELASALPYVGGEHVYVGRAFGRGVAFVGIWGIIFGYASVVVFEAIAFPFALSWLVPSIQRGYWWTVAGYDVTGGEVAVGALAAVAMTGINIAGVVVAARVQAIALLLLVGGGVVLVTGALFGESVAPAPAAMWVGWGGIATVLIGVPFLFLGFDVIPQSAEEIGAKPRDIGRMIVVSILAAVLFYVAVTLAVGFSGVGDNSLGAASAAARLWQSPTAGVAVVIAGIAGIITSWNAFLIGGSRAMFALAESGDLPRCFAALHPRFHTPWVAVLTIGGLSVFAPMLGRNALIWIVNAGGLGIVVSYGLVAAAFIALRRKEPTLPRPYVVPAGKWVATVGLALTAAMALLYLPGSPSALLWPQEWALLMGWCALGAVLWLASLRLSHRSRG